jgi:uncharacterized Zn finger protein
MANHPVPAPCPRCGSGDTEVTRLRVEYQPEGGTLNYAAGHRHLRCRECGAEFQLPLPPDDDPSKNHGS